MFRRKCDLRLKVTPPRNSHHNRHELFLQGLKLKNRCREEVFSLLVTEHWRRSLVRYVPERKEALVFGREKVNLSKSISQGSRLKWPFCQRVGQLSTYSHSVLSNCVWNSLLSPFLLPDDADLPFLSDSSSSYLVKNTTRLKEQQHFSF